MGFYTAKTKAYDKLAANYLAFIQLASIRLLLKEAKAGDMPLTQRLFRAKSAICRASVAPKAEVHRRSCTSATTELMHRGKQPALFNHLRPEKFDSAALARTKAKTAAQDWAALYQQERTRVREPLSPLHAGKQSLHRGGAQGLGRQNATTAKPRAAIA